MLLPLEFISLVIIIVVVFVNKQLPNKIKLKRFVFAIFIWLIAQVIIVLLAALIALLLEKSFAAKIYNLESSLNFISLTGFTMLILSTTLSLVLSKKWILRKY
jgi:lysylphosphatidylglycerol synthetase-like protein (DUF2156 family)